MTSLDELGESRPPPPLFREEVESNFKYLWLRQGDTMGIYTALSLPWCWIWSLRLSLQRLVAGAGGILTKCSS